MSDEEYRQEGINMQLKPIKDKIEALEEWKKIEEEQHQNITKALDNFVIDAGAIGDSVYSNKLKSLENEIADLKKQIDYLEDRYKESGGLRCLRDRGLIKDVLKDVGHSLVATHEVLNLPMLEEENKFLRKNLEKLDDNGVEMETVLQTEPELINTPEPLYPKVVYQLGSDSKEYIELKKKYDKLIEKFLKGWYELDNELTLEGKVRVTREKIEEYEEMRKK